jgi:hypothetical protein
MPRERVRCTPRCTPCRFLGLQGGRDRRFHTYDPWSTTRAALAASPHDCLAPCIVSCRLGFLSRKPRSNLSDAEAAELDYRVLRSLGIQYGFNGRGVGDPFGLALMLSSNPEAPATYTEADVAQSLKRLRKLGALSRSGSYGEVAITPAGLDFYRAHIADDTTQPADPSQEVKDESEKASTPVRNRVKEAVAEAERHLADLSADQATALEDSLVIDPRGHEGLQDYRLFSHTLGNLSDYESQSMYEILGEEWSPTNGGWAEGATLAQKIAIILMASQAKVEGVEEPAWPDEWVDDPA